jgi:phosphoglycolate phosphatase
MIHGFIFDLDGTLVDTLGDIARGMNSFLQGRGWPGHPVEAYRRMVGKGLLHLIRAAVPADQQELTPSLYPELLASYEAMGSGDSEPYPGVTATLRSLVARRVPLAVVSNKPDRVTRRVVAELFPDIGFSLVRGGLDGVPVKPHPAGALAAAAAMGCQSGDCAFVGDSDVDIQTAINAGMQPVGAAWGFRGAAELRQAGATLILDNFSQLLTLPTASRSQEYVNP